MQQNMAQDKQESHKEHLRRLWSHRKTTILCVCSSAQTEARRQATTEASRHITGKGRVALQKHGRKLQTEDSMCFP